eukprot:scaffold75216_cov28-Tisochrysis_lutea.AAC.7
MGSSATSRSPDALSPCGSASAAAAGGMRLRGSRPAPWPRGSPSSVSASPVRAVCSSSPLKSAVISMAEEPRSGPPVSSDQSSSPEAPESAWTAPSTVATRRSESVPCISTSPARAAPGSPGSVEGSRRSGEACGAACSVWEQINTRRRRRRMASGGG